MTEIFIPIAAARQVIARRPPDYMTRLRPCMVREDETGIVLDTAHPVYQQLSREFAGQRQAEAATSVSRDRDRGRGPGDLMGEIFRQLGYQKRPGCGCAAFAARMNAWGWRGCFAHRREIVQWFTAKAAEAGTPLTPRGVARIIMQVIRRHQQPAA